MVHIAKEGFAMMTSGGWRCSIDIYKAAEKISRKPNIFAAKRKAYRPIDKDKIWR
jgi:hypothetical protein